MSTPMWETGEIGPPAGELGPWDTVVLGGVSLPGRARVTASRERKYDTKAGAANDGATHTDQGYKVCSKITVVLTIWNAKQLAVLEEAMAKIMPVPRKAAPPGPQRDASGALPIPYADDRVNQPSLPFDATQAAAPFLPPAAPTPTADDYLPGPYLPVLYTPGYLEQISSSAPAPKKGQTIKPLSIYHPSLAMPPLRIRSVLVKEVENLRPGTEKGTMEMTMHFIEFMPSSSNTVTATASGTSSDITKEPQAIPSGPSSSDVGP